MEKETNPFVLVDESPIVKTLRNVLGLPSLLGVLGITVIVIQSEMQANRRIGHD